MTFLFFVPFQDPAEEWVEAPAPPTVSQKAWKIQTEEDQPTTSPADTSKVTPARGGNGTGLAIWSLTG